jgi:hypothetical protein
MLKFCATNHVIPVSNYLCYKFQIQGAQEQHYVRISQYLHNI